MIGGFLCACALCVLLAGVRNGRHPALREWIYFAVCVVGALINTLAPGNFVRHKSYASDGGLYFGDAIVTTFEMIENRFGRMISEGWLIGVVIAAAAIAAICVRADAGTDAIVYAGKRGASGTKMRLTPIGAAIGSFGCIYASFFPPVLAYHTTMDDPYLGIRVDYVTGWIMAIAVVFVTVYTVLWVRVRLAEQARGMALMLVIAFVAIGSNAIYIVTRDVETYIPRFYYELGAGRLKSFYETRYTALNFIETTDEDVIYLFDWLTVSHIMKDFELSYDTSWWINQVMAAYYGKAAISYSPPLEDYEIHADEL